MAYEADQLWMCRVQWAARLWYACCEVSPYVHEATAAELYDRLLRRSTKKKSHPAALVLSENLPKMGS